MVGELVDRLSGIGALKAALGGHIEGRDVKAREARAALGGLRRAKLSWGVPALAQKKGVVEPLPDKIQVTILKSVDV